MTYLGTSPVLATIFLWCLGIGFFLILVSAIFVTLEKGKSKYDLDKVKFKKSFEICDTTIISNMFGLGKLDDEEFAKDFYAFEMGAIKRFITYANKIKKDAKELSIFNNSSYWRWCYESMKKLVYNLRNNVADAYIHRLHVDNDQDSKFLSMWKTNYLSRNFLSITDFDDYNGLKFKDYESRETGEK